jgi:thiol-disulfide isomerase/thioredoxin
LRDTGIGPRGRAQGRAGFHHGLLALALGLSLLGSACQRGAKSESESSPKASRSRYEAVEAKADPRFEPDQFCEQWQPGGGPAFSFPPLAEGMKAPEPGVVRWVNLWATWCGPCVEEFPRIVEWKTKLAKTGHPAEVVFVSVDGPDAKLDEFAKAHPEVEGSLQIGDPDQLAPWLVELGLPEGSVLPIHLFVDAAGKLRCVRMGGVGPEDYPGVKAVVAGIGAQK